MPIFSNGIISVCGCAAIIISLLTFESAQATMPPLKERPKTPTWRACRLWAAKQDPDAVYMWGRQEDGTSSRIIALSRLSEYCMGREPPDIVAFGSSTGFDVAFCERHKHSRLCLSPPEVPGKMETSLNKPTSYLGRWIEDQGTCDNSQPRDKLSFGTYEFTEGQRYHFEGTCKTTAVSKQGRKWELDEECHGGGENSHAVTHMHWSMLVEGDKMTAMVTHPGEKPGAPFVLTRCVPEAPAE